MDLRIAHGKIHRIFNFFFPQPNEKRQGKKRRGIMRTLVKRGLAYLRRLGLLLTAKANTWRRGDFVVAAAAARDRRLLYGPKRRVESVSKEESERGWL